MNGIAKVGLDGETLEKLDSVSLLKDLCAPFTGGFDSVHRSVGITKKVTRKSPTTCDGNPEATRQFPTGAAAKKRVTKHRLNAIAQGGQIGIGTDPVGDDDELVSAHPSNGLPLPGYRAKPGCEFDQERVAGGVAKVVVENLEFVDIEEKHRDRRPVRAARESAWLIRSRHNARLGSPVSGSCRDWRSNSALSACCSETSRAMPSRPTTVPHGKSGTRQCPQRRCARPSQRAQTRREQMPPLEQPSRVRLAPLGLHLRPDIRECWSRPSIGGQSERAFGTWIGCGDDADQIHCNNHVVGTVNQSIKRRLWGTWSQGGAVRFLGFKTSGSSPEHPHVDSRRLGGIRPVDAPLPFRVRLRCHFGCIGAATCPLEGAGRAALRIPDVDCCRTQR